MGGMASRYLGANVNNINMDQNWSRPATSNVLDSQGQFSAESRWVLSYHALILHFRVVIQFARGTAGVQCTACMPLSLEWEQGY
jgi:hypothetical protein